METFKINMTIDGQTVEASGSVSLGRYVSLTMTAPYSSIDTTFFTLDENHEIRQFYDIEEVKKYAEKELLTVMQQVQYVKQYRKEYTEALNLYEARRSRYIAEFEVSEESHKRGSIFRKLELQEKAFGEYVDLLHQLIPVSNVFHIISPSLLSHILEAI